MNAIKPESMVSSSVFTINILKVDETRKTESIKGEKSDRNMGNLNSNHLYKQECGLIDDSNNNNEGHSNSPKNMAQKQFDFNKKNEEERKKLDFDEKIFKSKQNSLFINCNRLMYSKKCINFYIFLIIISVAVFLYSIFCYFAKLSIILINPIELDELPIIICEIILIIIITIDMLARIFTTGCKTYFGKCFNWLDLILIILSALTIFLYLRFHNFAQEIEDISFALLIFIRNSSQLLRLYILLKNQKEVRKNIEEIIHFSSEFVEKNFQFGLSKNAKSNSVLSYVDGQNTVANKDNKHFRYENFQDHEMI